MSWRRSALIALLASGALLGRASGTSGEGDGSVAYWTPPSVERSTPASGARQGVAWDACSAAGSASALPERTQDAGSQNSNLVWAYAATQTSTPSSPASQPSSARTCKVAEDCTITVELDEAVCTGEVSLYTRYPLEGSPIFPADSAYWDYAQPLLGRQYTRTRQSAYRETYDCIDAQCVWKKTQVQQDRCTYGCLFEPVTYNGKTWQSFCVCRPGGNVDVPLHCGGGTSRFGYMSYKDWTCEDSKKERMACSVGWKCTEVQEGGEQKLGCEPLGPSPFDYSATAGFPAAIAYSFLVPTGASGQIEVVAISGGRVIARRPIGMTTQDLLDGSGVLDQGNAYSVAVATGLTSAVPWQYARMTSRAVRTASAEVGAPFASSPWGRMCGLPVAGPTGR